MISDSKKIKFNCAGSQDFKYIADFDLCKVNMKLNTPKSITCITQAVNEIKNEINNDIIEIKGYSETLTSKTYIELIYECERQIYENIIELYFAIDEIEKTINSIMNKFGLKDYEITYEVGGLYTDYPESDE